MKHETKNKNDNQWKYITIAMGVLFIVSLYYNLQVDEVSTSDDMLTLDAASKKAIGVINDNLLSGGVKAQEVSKSSTNGLYKLNLNINGQNTEVFVSPDGKYLFTGVVDLDTPPTPPAGAATPGAAVDVSVDDDDVKGKADAPVTIIEFSDFECPFCGRFYSQTYKQLMKEYVDTGKVKYVFRDFPLGFHKKAQKAGEAAECAGDQDKFWEMHDKLFENQQNIDVSDLKKYAKDLGLDTTKFDTCLDSGTHAAEVKKDLADGQAAGVTGTPAFFINGKLLSGAQPFSAFKAVIDAELAK